MIRRTVVSIALICAAAAASAQDANPGVIVTPVAPPADVASPLVKIDTVVGTGKEAQAGATVVVHYTGWFFKPLARNQHGKQFDSSHDAGRTPLDFQLGAGHVIKGWEQGVAGMKVGGKRTLIIPSELAYGHKGAPGAIPPDSDLVFDVELLDVK